MAIGCIHGVMYGCFARPKKTGHGNEVAIRRGSPVPKLRLILGLGTQERCPFSLNRSVPSYHE